MNALFTKIESSVLCILLLVVPLLAGVNTTFAEELNLSGGATIVVDPFGAIKEARFSGLKLLGMGSVKGRMENATYDMLQAYPFVNKNKVKINNKSNEVNVSGTIAQGENGPDVAEFTITYKEKSESVLLVRVDLTYLINGDATGPLAFLMRFPVESFQGGTLVAESETGAEKNFEIANEVIDIKLFGSEKCVFSKDKIRVTCTAADGTQLNPGDARAWKDNSIWIEACHRWKWAKNYRVSNGQTETIEFTVAFEEKN